MAKPNHQFEKRQRDLKKQQKKEEKRLRKLERNAEPADDSANESSEGEVVAEGDGTETA